MKIKYAHLKEMTTMLWNTMYRIVENNDHLVTINDLIGIYETGNFPRSDRVKDLQKRFCFDMWNASGGTQYACDTLYDYLNDDHIYTALKHICPQVTKRY